LPVTKAGIHPGLKPPPPYSTAPQEVPLLDTSSPPNTSNTAQLEPRPTFGTGMSVALSASVAGFAHKMEQSQHNSVSREPTTVMPLLGANTTTTQTSHQRTLGQLQEDESRYYWGELTDAVLLEWILRTNPP